MLSGYIFFRFRFWKVRSGLYFFKNLRKCARGYIFFKKSQKVLRGYIFFRFRFWKVRSATVFFKNRRQSEFRGYFFPIFFRALRARGYIFIRKSPLITPFSQKFLARFARGVIARSAYYVRELHRTNVRPFRYGKTVIFAKDSGHPDTLSCPS